MRFPGDHYICSLLCAVTFAACGGNHAPTQPTQPSDCSIFSLNVPRTLALGQRAALSPFMEFCRPMFTPVNPSQVAWHSLDPAVVAISAAGVEGLAPGIGVVQGTYGDLTAQALIMVGPLQSGEMSTPLRLRLVGSPVMQVGQEAAFSAWLVMSDGTASNVSGSTNWRSSNTVVGRFVTGAAESIVLYGQKTGDTTIAASSGGMLATMAVSVK